MTLLLSFMWRFFDHVSPSIRLNFTSYTVELSNIASSVTFSDFHQNFSNSACRAINVEPSSLTRGGWCTDYVCTSVHTVLVSQHFYKMSNVIDVSQVQYVRVCSEVWDKICLFCVCANNLILGAIASFRVDTFKKLFLFPWSHTPSCVF